MNCPNCGSPLKENARFCPVCGIEIVYTQAPVERDVIDSSEANNKTLKIVLIVLISLVAAAIIGAGIYFLVNYISAGNDEPVTSECEECGEEFEGSGDLCEDCEEEKDKEKDTDSEDADKNTPKGECNQCHATMESDALLCEDCLDEILESNYSSGYRCNLCNDRIMKEEIAIVDTYGFVYCEYCDEGVYCKECYAPLARNDDDDVCYQCAEYKCYECAEVLKRSEVAATDEHGNHYCADCYEHKEETAECNQCGEEHSAESLLCDECMSRIDESHYAGYYTCLWCGAQLDKSEIAIVDNDGFVYCEDCDHGVYCENCNAPLPTDNTSGYCSYCE